MKRIALLSVFLCAATGLGLAPPPARPKLVVGIVIDQFRYDYLERFGDLFGQGGFRRLMEEGAVFSDAHYLHSTTVTAVGHSTFMTGSIPAQHGIIANQWFDRETGKSVTSVSDGAEASPRRLIGSTVGDELKLSNSGASHVVSVSMKDRSAILMAGHHPDGAYWFDSKTGRFVTSSYYMPAPPAWLDRFNSSDPAQAYLGKVWKPLRPAKDYVRSGVDDSPYEVPERHTFPYTVATFSDFLESPFSNELLGKLAKAAIENEKLGTHSATDLLLVSFSDNDEIGHEYGPYSHEVEDATLRTDLVLADLFDYLDRRVGRDNYVVALTADHGVAPIPEAVGGGRFTEGDVTAAVTTALTKRFGEEKWVRAYESENVYLDPVAAERRRVSVAEVSRVAADAVRTLPQIAAAYTADDFESGRISEDTISQRVARSYYRGRTGDVLVIPKPYFTASKKSSGHGSPYSYDTNVPVILWGSWFVPGRYTSAVSPADIAPTLSSILRITRPSTAVGRTLSEAIRQPVSYSFTSEITD
jgi:arylsulfatase A-like enzyme